jgi:hypothetical protein
MQETTLFDRLPLSNFLSRKKRHSVNLHKKEIAVEILTYFFILLFSYAALRKLVDLGMFVREVWGFALLGSKIAIKWEFIILITVELIVASLLAIPRTRLFGWYGSFVLMVAINAIMFFMQQYANVIPNYYGGIIPFVPFIVHFSINILLLILALIGLLNYLDIQKKLSFNKQLNRFTQPSASVC